jgi:hypothetical protein
MIIQPLVLAFALLATGVDIAFPDAPPTVVRVERNVLNHPSKPIKIDKDLQKRIATALEGGESELGVFFGNYTITIMYQHKREQVFVTDKYFRFRGRTYVMKEDVGAMLSSIPGQQ